MNIETKVDEIISLYSNFGNEDYIGEPVSQIEHMVQCAQLAEEAGAEQEVILAAFFHDIGHLCEFAFPDETLSNMNGLGVVNHEKIGANYLRNQGFSEKIAKLVESHVQAKRYLTYTFPNYYNQLSEASKKTLEFQGGVMTEEEALNFESDELSELYVALRLWDEKAKEPDKPMPDLDHYKNMMINHLTSNQKNGN
ncbi:MAG: phosphonate degradation HD-domain oxygenase [Bacteroidia bacterium]